MVERDPVTSRYHVGYAALQVAAAADYDGRRPARAAHPRPRAEQVGESVTLAAARRFSLVYIDQVDPPGVAEPRLDGRSLPLHATSSGKVFLAWLPEDERDAVLLPHLEAYTAAYHHRPCGGSTRPRRDPAHRVQHVRRRTGGVPEWRFRSGARRPGRPMVIVNIWGPSPRVTRQRLPAAGPDRAATAHEIAPVLR